MKKNEKRMILILIIILVIAIIAFVGNKNKNKEEKENKSNEVAEEFVQVLDGGTKLNTSKELGKTKQVGVFKFENIQLTEQGNQSVLLADITNTGSSKTDVTIVDIILLDKNGAEIVKVKGIIKSLDAGEKTQFNTSMTLDYANAYDFKIVLE